jgi:hypothetical protein
MDFGNISTNIIKKGLVFNMDAANRGSYPKTGTTATDTINTITSTLNGATFLTTNNGVFNLDGIDDKITITSDSKYNQLGTGPWTFSIFMKKTSTTGGSQYDGIFYMSLSNRLKFQSSDQVVYLEIGDSDLELFNYGSSMVGSWHQITVVREDNGNALGYVDSILKGTTSYSGKSFSDSNNMLIGQNTQYLPAEIGNFQFYNRALSASEVLFNYNGLKSRFGL